jgi:hypothetical protein
MRVEGINKFESNLYTLYFVKWDPGKEKKGICIRLRMITSCYEGYSLIDFGFGFVIFSRKIDGFFCVYNSSFLPCPVLLDSKKRKLIALFLREERNC